MHLDEMGRNQQPTRPTTWGVIGRTPMVKVDGGREKVSVLSATLCDPERGDVSHEHDVFFGSVRGVEVAAMLREMAPLGPLAVVMDNASIHKKAVETLKDEGLIGENKPIVVEWMPPYCPEFDSEEWVFAVVKQRLGKYNAPTILDLAERVQTEFDELTVDVLKGCLRQPAKHGSPFHFRH